MEKTSLYIHIPFCQHRCSYCDFNTYAGQEGRIPAYIEAICSEITRVALSAGAKLPVHTVYFGGGTPSLLSSVQIDRILSAIDAVFDLQPDAEITLEANPGAVCLAYLRDLKSLGVNRISYGMQSANSGELRFLDRQHSTFDVAQSVAWARAAGFDNLSLDLIYGLPGQTLALWQNSLKTAIALHPDHLSMYALTIEPGTLLFRRSRQGLLPQIDDDLAAEMYEYASDTLESSHYHQYEVSNWAQRGCDGLLKACLHNMQYWRNRPYLGFGAGAHGYANGRRTANVNGILAFVKRCHEGQVGPFPVGPAADQVIIVDQQAEMQETMMVGLRLIEEGVSPAGFRARFGLTIDEVFGKEIDGLVASGLLTKNSTIRLTKRARLIANQVFRQFIT
jgi:oxygen-independent coproporphyrinogen-3 oxidase